VCDFGKQIARFSILGTNVVGTGDDKEYLLFHTEKIEVINVIENVSYECGCYWTSV
jgi:hypothetical protein